MIREHYKKICSEYNITGISTVLTELPVELAEGPVNGKQEERPREEATKKEIVSQNYILSQN